MPEIMISTENDKTKFPSGSMVVLTAKTPDHVDRYQWKYNGASVAGQTSAQYEFKMTADAAGEYVVAAVVGGSRIESSPVTLSLDDAASPPATTNPASPPETPPIWHPWFAVVVAVIGIAVAASIFGALNLFNSHSGFANADWTSLEGRLKVGVTMALPLVVLGAITLLTGLWMAIVEWRGRFKDVPAASTKGINVDPEKIIDVVGKLRGAALAMVVGAILLLGAAWIAQAAAGTPSEPSTSASPTPSP